MDLRSATLEVANGKSMNLNANQNRLGFSIDIGDAKLISQKQISASAKGGSLQFNTASSTGPGTRIVNPNNNMGQFLILQEGDKEPENGSPEKGSIIVQ
ncbi:hypothetical protein [Halosegnis longus]